MSEKAINKLGQIVNVNSFTDESWSALKSNYEIGELKMICCDSNAIPKTSIKFKKFFAHQKDECNTAPETLWHKTSKKIIVEELAKIGYEAREEKFGNKWIADVYVEIDGRKIVFEIQHSPQTLTKYLERQNKYLESNIESYWLLYQPRYKTLKKAILNKLKKKYGNELLENVQFPSLNNLPSFYIDEQDFNVKGVGLFNLRISDFLENIIHNKIIFDKTWCVK